MQKKLMLIINPVAGRGAYTQNFAEAMKILSYGGYDVTLFYTQGRGDASRFAAENASAYDTVACDRVDDEH